MVRRTKSARCTQFWTAWRTKGASGFKNEGSRWEIMYFVVKCGLPRLIEYFEKEQITGIQLREQDQLKTAWCALDEEAAEEIKALVESGADVHARDENGDTVLQNAITSGSADVVSLLLDRGANIDALDEKRHNPLGTIISNNTGRSFDEDVAVRIESEFSSID
ncbi:hypothetical protein V7S43_014574 [Phytophthora oleae]|uniref:Ankyrin repeat domain-containing protein n=1 Tax=Phytophthora oleae TaxID=2107226 RepID=A0ABD3F1X3_9STRA